MSNSPHEKLAFRLADILARAYQGEPLIPADMAERYQVSLKTIQRDLKRLNSVLEKSDENGAWKLIFRPNSLLNRNDIKALIHSLGVYQASPKKVLDLVSDLVNTRTPDYYHFSTASVDPANPLAHHHSILEKAIRERHVTTFTYKGKTRRVHPYLMFYHNGLWYLRATEKAVLKSFYIGDLKLPRLIAEKFELDQVTLEKFRACNSPWISGTDVEIKLRIAAEASHHFVRRPMFTSQKDSQFSEDGSMVITLNATCHAEVLPIVQYWLPHIEVISPVALKKIVLENIEKYLMNHQRN